jgi:uncharacterized protein (DUF2062 family)
MVGMLQEPVGDGSGGCQARRTWRAQLIERIAQCDTPHRTAAAFACGVFLSFSPFLGLQVVVAIAMAFLLRLSRVALFAGLCMNLPWIMVPWYTLTTVAAAALLGAPVGPEVRASLVRLTDLPIYQSAFWTQALTIVSPFFWSFVVGSTLGALCVGLFAYIAVVRIVTRMQTLPATPGELVPD